MQSGDPFAYRDSTAKRPTSKHQKVNVFKVRPLWSQPTYTKGVYSLTAPGVFVNASSEDVHSQSGGSPNKRATKGIPRGTDVLIASEPLAVGGQPPASVDDEFEVQAFYAYVKQEGTPIPVEIVPPVEPRYDDSAKWFVGTRPWAKKTTRTKQSTQPSLSIVRPTAWSTMRRTTLTQ